MAAILGKRKRQVRENNRSTKPASEEPSETQNEDVQDIFRRHFEAHFKPLSTTKKPVKAVDKNLIDEEEEESEWEGISEHNGTPYDRY